jgi:hypothetical protein
MNQLVLPSSMDAHTNGPRRKTGAIILALLLVVVVWATTIVYSFNNGSSATFTYSGGSWSASHSFGESYSGMTTPQAHALLNDWTAAGGGLSGPGDNKELH